MKTVIVTFLENKRLFARTTYIRLLIYLKAIYRQKMKEIDFLTSCYGQDIDHGNILPWSLLKSISWSIFPDRRS